MNDIINSIINTPIPTIFVVVGILLLFLAIGGQFTTKVITANVKPKHAGVLGSLFLIFGLALHAMPVLVPIPKPPDQKSVTIPAPVIKPPVKDLKGDNKQDYTNTYYRDKADFNEARKVSTVDAYETFIKKHSRSDWKETAIYYRDEAALSDARKVGTVDAYETFIMSYPRSDWKEKAIYYRDKAELNDARNIDTVEAYENFLKKYPNSAWKDKAVYYQDVAASKK